jgi:prephenate dehydratase
VTQGRRGEEATGIDTMRIAIQGETGSFSDEAARTFLPGCSVVPCVTSSDVFDRLDSGGAAAALVPIENSLAGPVAQHLDLLLARDVFIQREFRLRIRHNLIAAPGVKLKDVRRVYSHPVALEQCRDFFRRHRQARAESFYDTAGSVRHIVTENLRDAAAIAGSRAAAVYQGRILLRGLEDDKQNFTRFFLVSRSRRVLRAANKTSIAFALKNAPGALFKALSVFALRDIDLSKIESRPFRGRPFEYVFFIDYLRADDEAARKALAHLAEIAEFVKVLGIYPAA